MITQTLHQNWTLDMPGMGKLPAAVPGSVYADLLAAGKLEDPSGGTTRTRPWP